MSQIPDLNLPYESDPEEDMDIEDVNSFIDSMYGGPAVWEEPTGLAYWGYSQSQVSDVLVDLAVSDASGLFVEFCGTSKAVIENLDSFFITQQDVDDDNVATCAICLEEMNVGDFAKQLPCFHRYHGDCIQLWLQTHNTCPVCRFPFPTNHMCNPKINFDIICLFVSISSESPQIFPRDGHRWRKEKDGMTVRKAHEKLEF